MNSKLRAQVFTMAVAALGIGATACAKKSEPAAPETPAATSGAEESLPAEGTPGEEGTAPATEGGSAEGQGGESSCGGGSCGSSGGK